MLEMKFIKEHVAEIREVLEKRGKGADLERLFELDDNRLELISSIESLRAERNSLSKEHTLENIERNKEIKGKLKELEPSYKDIVKQVRELQMSVPNVLHPDVPVGKDESSNVEVRRWGDVKTLDFAPVDHETLGTKLKLFDLEKAVEVAGSGFYYLTGDAVLLEFAIVTYALRLLMKESFFPMITPELVRKKYADGTGYLPRREEPDIYKVENEDLYLIATAEIPLAAYHAGDILKEDELPKKYVGFSSCFRKEAGAYGKHKKGIFRVHQFDKLEMFAFTKPEDSMDTFHNFVGLSEQLIQDFGIPYRVVNICSGDMNGPGYIKYDLEYYSPVDNEYRELTSCTNTTDYQARRLNVRYKGSDGKTGYVHILNNTTAAIGRTIIAIMDNYQQKDGTIRVPDVLQDYVGKEVLSL